MASENSSSYPDDSELELSLGLSLGGGGKTMAAVDGGGGWCRYARILTAKDFPSSSSSSSSCSPLSKSKNNNNGSNCGTKRIADNFSPPGRSAVSQVAGWPPIGIHRMNSLINHSKSPPTEESTSTVDKCKSTNIVVDNKTNRHMTNNVAKERGLLKTSLFVKVNMDGISIGRKVDLNAHRCYETLARTLDQMFTVSGAVGTKRSNLGEQVVMGGADRPARLLDGSADIVLTYEDRDGDWMLVGDVPWEMFLSSVRRLRIRRTAEAKGLVPRR